MACSSKTHRQEISKLVTQFLALTRGFITLTLIPADLSRIIMLHYNRSAILGKECII